MKTKNLTGSEAVIKSLIAEKVDTIFGYPGGAIMPVYDALFDYTDQIRHILTRHEQGLIHAAQGYARASGKVGVCLATSGPGATNLITGIADAMIDSTPLVCIIGQVPSSLLGSDAFQEADVIGMTVPCTKWNYQVTKVEEIPEVLSKAFYIAKSGRPGPVVVVITKDAQINSAAFDYAKTSSVRTYQPHNELDTYSLQIAAQIINEAKKPFVVFGQGVILSEAEEELKKFLEKSGIPAASTLLGLSALPSDHPNYMGMLGMHGNYAPNLMTNQCDVLIGIGLRFDDRVTGDVSRYAQQAKIIHVDIDKAEHNKVVKVDVPILGDAKEVLEALSPLVNSAQHEDWTQEFIHKYNEEYEQVISKDLHPQSKKASMGLVVKKLSEQTNNEAILVSDVGQHQMIASRYFQFKESRSNVTSGGLGTMGFSLPAALGAQLGAPKRTVIAVIGDGGFQMTLQELGTIAQYQIPVKIVILNNSFLGMVRQWQELFFKSRYSFTDMHSPDFVKVADAYEIPGQKVENQDDLDAAIAEMLACDGPYLLEVVVEKEDNVFPMITSGSAVDEVILQS
ncbi:biosynthetic-type acetolactate synthase large subunit [Lentimicrobium sp. S6]|uniref:biosynthetic-type acetolactate synthase large subunit n=1 Tax=Lentimicrobium sp. S6 TaxID=2735872 RepID=UPI0015581CB4|nr:biosynthetic-type acetolactate synthase large subunit [Lentimicrobium sp. S6]NPD45874.1 biosynthetic-type acetolactate synthase large subunit [Lentimicrobium sp. S6]